MRCWRGLEEIPADWDGSAVTIGVFDGVHRGHQLVIGRALSRGRELGLPAVVVTFDPRPVEVLAPDKAPPALTTVPTRIRLLAELDVDAVLVLPFTRELSRLGPEDFVRTALLERLHAHAVVVGEDFRFGHRAAGDVTLLHKLGESWDFAVEGVQAAGEGDAAFSSSGVRERVANGDVAGAERILGRPHRVEGRIERGDGRGRDMGYPTANVACPRDAAIPMDGVYAGWLSRRDERGEHEGERWPAAVSIGTNPTFEGAGRRVEAYVLDRDDLALYGDLVTVEFVERLRDTLRFDSAAELVSAMDRDVARAGDVLRGA